MYFISLILTYQVRKITALLRCTPNQVGTGYKLNSQPKNPARAKLAAINNQKMAVAGLRFDADSSEVFHIIDIIISGHEKDSFDPLYRQTSWHRP